MRESLLGESLPIEVSYYLLEDSLAILLEVFGSWDHFLGYLQLLVGLPSCLPQLFSDHGNIAEAAQQPHHRE